MDEIKTEHQKIRRISMDKFYEIVTQEKDSFKQLCNVLPKVLEDVVSDVDDSFITSTVYDELKEYSHDILQSFYKLSFSKYEGF